MTPPAPTTRWSVLAAVAVLVALVAGGAAVAQVLARPAESVGQGLAATTAPSATPTPRPTSVVPTRDASLGTGAARPAGAAPTSIRVPDLGVDATVDPVGVQQDGAMVIPAAPTSVGWYRFGAVPASEAGHTVIAGHVATQEDGPGAFAPLVGAEPGMRVDVVDADGTTHRYEVVGREAIRKKALPVERIFARDGEPLLVLVTCGGEYLPELRSHRDNIVVTARPVDG